MTNHTTRIASLFAALALSWAVLLQAADEAPVPNQAQRLVFMADHLHNVGKGSVLVYDFAGQGKDETRMRDTVRVKVTDVLEDQTRNMEFEFLTGDNHIDFEPATGYTGNPVVIHFLERDISRMVRATGGSNSYFRNGIRRSFKRSEMQSIEIAVAGKKLQATKIVVRPFLNDPNIERFATYTNKSYEFVFSEQIPGSVYRIHTLMPGESVDKADVVEELTFSRLTPAG